ncbi:MAG TPA: ADOP family duplicated permease [Bryobacteraceae bacterium]|nr:ADOP family duplicated permease [Bryobacteraceae bacterium]
MSLWSRVRNAFRGDSLSREILEEYEAHLADAVADGLPPAEARRQFGRPLGLLEASRDFRLLPWLDSLRGDVVFAWRQLKKNKVTSLAAVLSIGLAMGACASAFRLIDALLLRPMPVDHPERLFVLSHEVRIDGRTLTGDSCAYPMFRQMRALVKDEAELVAISYVSRVDLTFSIAEQIEKANQQYVSGWMFREFGLHPALGRVFTEDDDKTPGAHPLAVLSYDYWQRRFGGDPHIVGRSFRIGNERYQIIGVVQKPFSGTDTGTMVDIFLPTMMMKNNAIARDDYQWFRTFVKLKAGVAPKTVRDRLDRAFHDYLREYAKTFRTVGKEEMRAYLSQRLLLNSAAPGVSKLQADYGLSLFVLGVLVLLVLAIASLNVANLRAVNAAARSREIALRLSIGAGMGRLLQLVLIESALLVCAGAAAGGVFALWSAPYVMGMIDSPVTPAQLNLAVDWRVLGFSAMITFAVTVVLCLPAAWRVSAIEPVSALRGDTLRSRSRLIHSLTAAQAGFGFLVLFVATLFITSFDRLSKQPTGFNPDRVVTLETLTAAPVKAVFWEQVADRLRSLPGVASVGLSEWPLMTGESWNNAVSVSGRPNSRVPSYFLSTSPAWREVMRIPVLEGRDFRAGDEMPGSAIVNDAFAREYFGSGDPLGKSFDMVTFGGSRVPFRVVGRVADARYRDMREPMAPVAYVPFSSEYSRATFIVRTVSENPLTMASRLRQEIVRSRADFHVSSIRTQNELIASHTVRERLLATLAFFFVAIALLLAGVGLYGLLNDAVLQRRREIGIRMALGAKPGAVALRMAAQTLLTVLLGVVAGFALALAGVSYIQSLLYGVKATEIRVLAGPGVIILMLAFIASMPAMFTAARVDPARTLRAE